MENIDNLSPEFEQVIHQLYEIVYQQSDMPISSQVSRLIAEHAAYRGVLVLLMAQMLDQPPVPTMINCEDCLEQLPAFVDYEIDYGTRAAAHAYAPVWWSLWTCAECLAQYLELIALHTAIETGELRPLAPPQCAPPTPVTTDALSPDTVSPPTLRQRLQAPLVVLLRLSRQLLHATLSARMQLGTAMGDEAREEMVLSTRKITTAAESVYTLTVSLLLLPNNSACQIVITVVPLPQGLATIKLDDMVFTIPLDQQGQAITPTLPVASLTAGEGPDLEVELTIPG